MNMMVDLSPVRAKFYKNLCKRKAFILDALKILTPW